MKRYLIAACILIATFVTCVLVVPALAFGQGTRNGAAEAAPARDAAQSRLQTQPRLQDGACDAQQTHEQDRAGEDTPVGTQDEESSCGELMRRWTTRFMAQLTRSSWRG